MTIKKMYVIKEKNFQDKIVDNQWYREWILSLCDVLVDRYPVLIPPQVPVMDNKWIEFQEGLHENLRTCLKSISFEMVETRWLDRTEENKLERPLLIDNQAFYWNMMIPSGNGMDVLMAIFSLHMTKGTGAFDFEFFYFDRNEIQKVLFV